MIRSLSRGVDVAPPALGNAAPRGFGREAIEARERLAEFLDASLTRPMIFTDEQNAQRVVDVLDTMTLTERVFAEVEMQARANVMHAYDYDPLRYGR